MTHTTAPSDTIAAIAAPLAASLGLALWGIELQFGSRSLVRVYVEGENGVTIEQCAELSRLLGLGLEVEDIMPGPYMLEVSSPGLERIYFTEEQLARAAGERVEITLARSAEAFPGRKKFWGTLSPAEDGIFSLRTEEIARPGEEPPVLRFTFSDLKKAKRLHSMPEKTLPGKKPKTGGEKSE